MFPPPPRSIRTDTLCPYTTLYRSRTPGAGQRLTIVWAGNVKQRSRSGNGSAKRRLSGASERLPLAADMPSVGSAGDQSSSLRNEGPNPVGISLCRVPADLVQPCPRLTLGFGDFAS